MTVLIDELEVVPAAAGATAPGAGGGVRAAPAPAMSPEAVQRLSDRADRIRSERARRLAVF
jgi:hypothetical protein